MNNTRTHQLYVRPLIGSTYSLSVPTNLSLEYLQQCIEEHDGLPTTQQRLTLGERACPSTLCLAHMPSPIHVQVQLRVCGGKGGFGSLLRGSQPGAAKITTTNFGACRDLNGRRIRHVEQERELTEWSQRQQEQAQENKQQKKHRTEKGPAIELESFNEESEALALSVSDTVQEALKDSPTVPLLPVKRSPPSDVFSAPKRMKGDDFLGFASDDEDPNPSPALQPKKKELPSAEPIQPPTPEPQEDTTPAPTPTPVASVQEPELLDLEKYESVEELIQQGADILKSNLESRGLKCGGSPQQRAERLFAVRGLPRDQWDRRLLAPKKKTRR